MPRGHSVVFFILLTTSAFSQKIPLIHSGTTIEKGKSLYDSGKYDEAIKEFYKVAERDTNYVLMLTEAALASIAAEKYDDVLALCAKGLANPSPYTPYFLRYRAIAEDKRGNFARSEEIFLDAIKKYPADYGLMYNLGVTYYNNKFYEKAAAAFFNVLSIYPFHSGSHLNLGRIAIGQGRKVHAMLSFGMYLSISNTDNARLVLLNNFLDNQVTDEGSVPLFGTNEPEKLDQIIRAKIAMDQKFKTQIAVDAVVVRQFEMFFQQIRTIREETSDPWIKTYLPIYRFIAEQKLVEPFVYHMLSSAAHKDVKKWISKNEKTLKSFYASVNTIIKKQREVVSLATFGYPEPIQAWYNDGNTLTALGEFSDETRKGPWKFFYLSHAPSAEGVYNEKGLKTGIWKYYNNDGTVKSVEDYSSGEVTVYYPDGTKREHFYLTDDKIHGEVELFFPCGPLKEKLAYQHGKRHGKGQTYHVTGAVDMTYQYLDNKADGEFRTYYVNRQLQTVANYKAGALEGMYQSWYSDGKLESQGRYHQDRSVGPWTHYYRNGRVERSGNYSEEGDAVGEWLYYDPQGTLTESRQFDEDGRLQGPNSHYHDNKVHYVNTYNKDILIGSVFYDRSGKEIARQGKDDGTFAVRNYFGTGQLQSEGHYRQGKADGLWRYYNRFGKLVSEYRYADGLLQGRGVEYYPSGAKKLQLEYKDNVLDGYFQEFYKHGPVKQEGWFLNGKREQQWLSYFPDGTLETDGYYLRDSFQGPYYSYSPDGKLHSVRHYDDNMLADVKHYDSKGNLMTARKTENHVQVFEERFNNKQLRSTFRLLCGNYTDDVKNWYPDGTVYYSIPFQEGKKDGPYIHHHMSGRPVMEGVYVQGQEQGHWKFFSDDGVITREGRYLDGLKDSVWIYFYDHGKISSALTYRKDELEGLARYFSPEGEPVLEKMFVGGDLVAWRPANENEEGAPWQNFSGTDTISVRNTAGTVVYEETYRDGMREGYKKVYFNNGTLCEAYHYRQGDFEGPYATYYPNGQVAKRGTFEHDELNGKVESFNADGTLRKVETFYMGTAHGEAAYYKGKSRKKYTFWDGMME